jgi:hypothetical protein
LSERAADIGQRRQPNDRESNNREERDRRQRRQAPFTRALNARDRVRMLAASAIRHGACIFDRFPLRRWNPHLSAFLPSRCLPNDSHVDFLASPAFA